MDGPCRGAPSEALTEPARMERSAVGHAGFRERLGQAGREVRVEEEFHFVVTATSFRSHPLS